MGEPDAFDVKTSQVVPFTCDDQRQYMNSGLGGLVNTHQGFKYDQVYVEPYEPGQAPDSAGESLPPSGFEPPPDPDPLQGS